jgi:hypothetical protein
LDGSFRWKNHRHRRALLEPFDPAELGDDDWAVEVVSAIECYRRNPHRPDGHWFAQRLEGLALGLSEWRQ